MPTRSAISRLGSPRLVLVVLAGGWALWTTLIALSNATELLWSVGVGDPRFRSGNVDYIGLALQGWTSSRGLAQILLVVATAWEAMAAILLWIAAIAALRGSPSARPALTGGLLAVVALMLGFVVGVEATVSFERVDNALYFAIAGTALASLVAARIVAAER